MRIRLAFALLLLPATACALSLSFPKEPQAIRQVYADGTWTELARVCPESEGDGVDEDLCKDVFRVHEGLRTVEHVLPLRGLREVLYRQPYQYYPGEDGRFSLYLEAACSELDNARIGAKPYESAYCRIDIQYDGKSLEPVEDITIFDDSGGHGYDLEPEWPVDEESIPRTMTFTGFVRRTPSGLPCTEPAAVIYEVDTADAGEAWSDRTMAVRVPCERLDPATATAGGPRLPYKEFDVHRVRVTRTTVQYGEDFIGPVVSYWLVEETVPIPDPAK